MRCRESAILLRKGSDSIPVIDLHCNTLSRLLEKRLVFPPETVEKTDP